MANSAAAEENTAGGRRSLAYLIVVVVATMAVLGLSYADQAMFGVVLPRIKVELHLTDGELGLLSGVPFAVCYSLFSIPAAWLGDTRVRRSSVVAASLTIWSAMTALCSIAGGLWSLFFLRMGVGAGEAGGRPAALTVVTDMAPERWRRRMIAICSMGVTFGGAGGLILTGLIVTHYGWRAAFVLLGAPGVAVALIYRLLVQDPPHSPATRAPSNFLGEMKELFSSRAFLGLFGGCAFTTCLSGAAGAWMPTYLIRTFKIGFTEVGAVMGAVTLIAGLVSPVCVAWLGDRLAARDSRWPLRLCAITLSATVVAYLAFFSVHQKIVAYLLLASAMFVAGGLVPLMTGVAQDVVPRLRTTGIAAMAFGASGIGAFAPWAVGLISDNLSKLGEEQSLRVGLLTMIPVGALGILSFLAGAQVRHGAAGAGPRAQAAE